MLKFFDLMPPGFYSGFPDLTWPDGIDSIGMMSNDVYLKKSTDIWLLGN